MTSECIGCGYCCTKTICGAGMRLYSTNVTPCPALRWDGHRNYCELMTLPGALGEEYRKELYAGEGCCSSLNSWRYEPLQDRTKKDEPIQCVSKVPVLMQRFLRCLASQFMSKDCLYLAFYQMQGELIKDSIMTEDEAKAFVNECIDKIKSNRRSFIDEFIG